MLTNDILLMQLGQNISNVLSNQLSPTNPESAKTQNANTWRTITSLIMAYIVTNAQVNVQVPILPVASPSGPGTAGPGTGIGTVI